MNIATALFFLLILACPLMMVFMMRGHRHGGGHQHHGASTASVEELRRQRDELDREIAAREDGSRYSGWRSPDTEREGQETNERRSLARR